ncbi:MAG: helicase-exonuclease AddAB subunit AddA [Lachnospiraceae bacterium]|nr:helicase-exonuclease AddAB subunit AddA [Lachnospiraceae bacterium]
MAWTDKQQQVIDSRDHNLLVSAAAGSGKTAVMVERIIERISDSEHPVDIDHFLVVTFTNAAAAEMKERIMKALDEKVMKDPQNPHLLRQLARIQRAQITTLHSFCLNLIREHFMDINLDPGFRIGDEAELGLLLEEAVSTVLENAYETREEDFLAFLESYVTGRDDANVEKMLKEAYHFVRSNPDPKEWIRQAVSQFEVEQDNLFEQPWMKYYEKDLISEMDDILEQYDQIYEMVSMDHMPAGYQKPITQVWLSLQGLKEKKTIPDYIAFSKVWKKGRLGRKNSAPECEIVKNNRTRVTDQIKAFFTKLPEDTEGIVNELRKCHAPMKGYANLLFNLLDTMAKMKKERNMIDFADFEHFALSILSDGVDEDGKLIPSPVAMEKKAFFDEIYVDEYQDTNEIQEAIILLLCGEEIGKHNLFTVGDIKQSIYQFRQAKPELFIRRYDRYDAGVEGCELIELQNNFRSRVEVLDSTNQVFYKIMKRELGDIDYSERVSLIPGRSFEKDEKDHRSELLLLEYDKESEENKIEAEADMIGHRILAMVEAGEYEFRDMVILLRSTSNKAEKIQERLEKLGIPAYCESKKGSFDATEVQIVMNTLKVIDNERNDIPFASFLRAPFVGITSEELVYMTSLLTLEPGQKCPLCEHFHYYGEHGENETIVRKIKKAQRFLTDFKEKKTYLSLYDLIMEIVTVTDYFHYVGAMPGGKRRQANLRMLMEKAKTFENGSFKGLFSFVRYMNQLQEYKLEYGEANVLGEKENVVRILTIHKSKGLEYPVVFVGDLAKSFNMMDVNNQVLLHSDYYMGPNVIWPETREKKSSLLKNTIASKMKNEILGEELRMLYVAMTRAKEKLILTGIITDMDKLLEATFDKRELPPSVSEVKRAKCYLDWILMALRDSEAMGPFYENHRPGQGWENQSSPFVVRIWNSFMLSELEAKSFLSAAKKRVQLIEEIHHNLDESKLDTIKKEFEWKYDYEGEALKPIKYSVSEIKHKYMELMEASQEVETLEGAIGSIENEKEEDDKKELTKPNFLKETLEVSPTSRGTAVHKCMELLDFTRDYTRESLDDEIKGFIASGKVDDCYEVIPQNEILWFLQSEIGIRLKEAAKLHQDYKEKQFVMGVPLHKLSDAVDSSELVVVQGIVDLYFVEDDEIVIVDYKTDRVKKAGGQMVLLNRYKAQLDSYKLALEQVTGKKVKEVYISSFTLRKNIEVKTDE